MVDLNHGQRSVLCARRMT